MPAKFNLVETVCFDYVNSHCLNFNFILLISNIFDCANTPSNIIILTITKSVIKFLLIIINK